MNILWGRLVRDIYASVWQFKTVEELKLQIEQSWFSLKPEFLQTLILSMPNTVFKIIRGNCFKM